MSGLFVPQVEEDADILSAAMQYAEAGWYVMPLHTDSRRPALGKNWPAETSRSVDKIVSWFAGTDYLLGLHVGRSGAVVFDIDKPDETPEVLQKYLTDVVPHQSTRSNMPGRGHWVFAQPEGRYLGNSRGEMNEGKWGDIRGANGMIVVAPSRHHKSDQGGRYHWITCGSVPALPDEIGRLLPDFTGSAGAVSDSMISAFMDTFVSTERPNNLIAIRKKFVQEARTGARHESLVAALAWAMREAFMGFFPARTAVELMWQEWQSLMANEPRRDLKGEFSGALAWAVGAALADAPNAESRKADIAERMTSSALFIEPSQEEAKAVGGVKVPEPVVRMPSEYFGKDGVDVSLLADDVIARGPLAWGEDLSFWSYRNGVWVREPEIVEGRVVTLLGGRFRHAHASNVETVVKHRIQRLPCEPTPDHMNFENGMLNWKTGELTGHSPDYGSTVQFPFEFDENAKCPEFDKFLNSILSEDFTRLAWEMIGYLMMSGNPLQKAFMLLGTGANGKGTLIRVIEELLGRANIATQSLDALSNNRFAPVSLHAKIANLAGDIDKTYQESTAQFKMLTGEDTFPAEYKFKGTFNFRNWAVPVFSANAVPGSADTSEGYLRRWVVIEFSKTIPVENRIPGFSDTLVAEIPGIAVRAIQALREVMGRNQGRGQFHTAHDIQAGAEKFAENIDQVRQWVNGGSVLVSDAGQELQSTVFRAYKAWAHENGYGVLRSGEFYNRLESIGGIKLAKVQGVRYVRGLTIVQDNSPQASLQQHDAFAD